MRCGLPGKQLVAGAVGGYHYCFLAHLRAVGAGSCASAQLCPSCRLEWLVQSACLLSLSRCQIWRIQFSLAVERRYCHPKVMQTLQFLEFLDLSEQSSHGYSHIPEPVVVGFKPSAG